MFDHTFFGTHRRTKLKRRCIELFLLRRQIWRLGNRLFHFPLPLHRATNNSANNQIISPNESKLLIFFCAFSHTWPKGARITDTYTFHWREGNGSTVLHGLDLCWAVEPAKRRVVAASQSLSVSWMRCTC